MRKKITRIRFLRVWFGMLKTHSDIQVSTQYCSPVGNFSKITDPSIKIFRNDRHIAFMCILLISKLWYLVVEYHIFGQTKFAVLHFSLKVSLEIINAYNCTECLGLGSYEIGLLIVLADDSKIITFTYISKPLPNKIVSPAMT